MSFRLVSLGAVALCSLGCGATLIPILPSTTAERRGIGEPLEVIARSSGALDPLRVSGSRVLYGDFETALEEAVLMGARTWIVAHRASPGRGFNLTVELIHAESEYARGRLGVALVVRATLRRRSGNEFLGQTQAVCRKAKLVEPEHGGPVVFDCMQRLGATLGGWLDDVAP